MLGKFQKSSIRIEVKASAKVIRECLLNTDKLRQWLWTQRFSSPMPDKLSPGVTFTSWLGLVPIEHKVEFANDTSVGFLLSKGIDGYHEWCWGDGWVQSRLEGISLLPLNLGQTVSLLSLRNFLAQSLDQSADGN
jgi:hypothetical protein